MHLAIRSLCSLLVLSVFACAKSPVEARLETLTGNEFLSFDGEERSEFLEQTLHYFRNVHDMRPDFMCESVLNPVYLEALMVESAEAAGDNLLAFALGVKSNEWCLERGEVVK